jgi:hypothetical protein
MLTTDDMAMSEVPIVDGFTHSLSMLLLPTTYRALVVAQMETLRRSSNYEFKMHSAPDSANATIPAYSQNEYLVKMRPGTLVWGMWMSAANVDEEEESLLKVYVEVTDMDTGTPFISDYEIGQMLSSLLNPTPARVFERYPFLLGEPRLVSGSGQVTIETYNSGSTSVTVQLVLFCAEPVPVANPCDDPSVSCTQD